METFTFYLSFPGEAGSWVWRTKGANEPELVVQIQATGFTGLQLEATGISLYLSLFLSLSPVDGVYENDGNGSWCGLGLANPLNSMQFGYQAVGRAAPTL